MGCGCHCRGNQNCDEVKGTFLAFTQGKSWLSTVETTLALLTEFVTQVSQSCIGNLFFLRKRSARRAEFCKCAIPNRVKNPTERHSELVSESLFADFILLALVKARRSTKEALYGIHKTTSNCTEFVKRFLCSRMSGRYYCSTDLVLQRMRTYTIVSSFLQTLVTSARINKRRNSLI